MVKLKLPAQLDGIWQGCQLYLKAKVSSTPPLSNVKPKSSNNNEVSQLEAPFSCFRLKQEIYLCMDLCNECGRANFSSSVCSDDFFLLIKPLQSYLLSVCNYSICVAGIVFQDGIGKWLCEAEYSLLVRFIGLVKASPPSLKSWIE